MSNAIARQARSVIPSTDEIRRVLSAIRYDQPLADSPLTEIDAVWEILLREGVATGERGRAWALGVLVDEIVSERLEAARRAAGVGGNGAADERSWEKRLAGDFAAGSPELEIWSAVFHRYLDPGQLQSGDIASRAGIARRTLSRRLGTACKRLAEAIASREREAARRLADRADVPIDDRIVVRPIDGRDVESAPKMSLLEAVRGTGGARTPFAAETLERLASDRPADLRDYRLSRVAAWSRPAFRGGARFVDLTLLLDRGEATGERWEPGDTTFHDLGAVLGAVAGPAFVVLGPPGSGKSTLLRRLELDLAAAGLRDETEGVPFFVSLGRYWSDRPDGDASEPARWLARSWDQRYPDLPSFSRLLAEGRLVLLLDGFNEMHHVSLEDYRTRCLAWKRFLLATVAEHPGVRFVFACRSLDYGAPLSSPELRVPQIRIEPMTDAQVRAFLHRYAPAEADRIWAALEGEPTLELVRNPYLLMLLIEQALESGEMPFGRAALFTSFVRRALRREIERDNTLFQPGALLDERDYRRALSSQRWATPWSLPDRGALVPGLTVLAHGMQSHSSRTRAMVVGVEYDTAIELIDHPAAEDVVRAGEALGVLDERHGGEEVVFFHQLLLEYFTARRLASDPVGAAERIRREVRAAAVEPGLEAVLAELEATEPLPPLPSTGWEETVLLSASMSGSPADFVEALAGAYPPIAAHAATQPEIEARLPEAVIGSLRQRLVTMSADEGVDLRARIEAGLALGELGDPRFALRAGPDGPFLDPPMIRVPEGAYTIGDGSGAHAAAVPEHSVHIAAFEIGRFPVTNREWSHFMAAGGYDDDRWWDTDDMRAWRQGKLTAAGSRIWVRGWLDKMRADPSVLETYVEMGLSAEQEAMWRERLRMDEDELRAHLESKFPERRYTAPYAASRSQHSAPTQPVSGISWYEARAYCHWLSAQSGRRYRLPSEIEWEAAARGGDSRRFPWGQEPLVTACNGSELHVRRTVPIGVLPAGRAPSGAEMMAGDVREWTGSLWGADEDSCEFGYPYRADDGRESVAAPPTVRRIVRGGGFVDALSDCAVYMRDGLPPDMRFHGFGMRLARAID